MPLRSLVVVAVCAVIIATAAVGSSRFVGAHKILEDRIDELVSNDTGVGKVKKNLSPYCFLGACPKVSKVTETDLDIAETERLVLAGLRRYQYEPGTGSQQWRAYNRANTTIKSRIERKGSGEGSVIYWEASATK